LTKTGRFAKISSDDIFQKMRLGRREVRRMRCPYCGHLESKVVDSRPADDGTGIRRRRVCPGCGRRFTTYETVELPPLAVVKRDGSRQGFDRKKLIKSMLRACEKRSVPMPTLEHIADEIRQTALSDPQVDRDHEVPSARIGALVMDRLREVDEVAYIRFASVYRKFRDITAFRDALNRLLDERDTLTPPAPATPADPPTG